VEGEGAPATQAMGTAGRWGKTERRSRATHSAPHLDRGRTVEGDQRRRAVCNRDGTGGGGWRLGRERGRQVRLGGEAGAARVRFIGAGRWCSTWVEHAKLVLACSNGGPASLQ
jgi:hypothetical protein